MKRASLVLLALFLVGCDRELCESIRKDQSKPLSRQMHESELPLSERDMIRGSCRIYEYKNDVRGYRACIDAETRKVLVGRTVQLSRSQPPGYCNLPWN